MHTVTAIMASLSSEGGRLLPALRRPRTRETGMKPPTQCTLLLREQASGRSRGRSYLSLPRRSAVMRAPSVWSAITASTQGSEPRGGAHAWVLLVVTIMFSTMCRCSPRWRSALVRAGAGVRVPRSRCVSAVAVLCAYVGAGRCHQRRGCGCLFPLEAHRSNARAIQVLCCRGVTNVAVLTVPLMREARRVRAKVRDMLVLRT